MSRGLSYADPSQKVAFAQWLARKIDESGMTRTELAKLLWPRSAEHATTAQIKNYLEPKPNPKGRLPMVVLPAPPTLREMCAILQLSWTEAFMLAGYYGELLLAFHDLERLAMQWRREDGATENDDEAFAQFGTVLIRSVPVQEAMQDRNVSERYIEISFDEECETEPFPPTDDVPPEVVAEIEALARESSHISVIVPKPLAVAILIAVAGFPRRGDIYKQGVTTYAAHLLHHATDLVNLAQKQGYIRRLPALLQRANAVLKDRSLPLDSKRIIAAEYLVAWADRQCSMFTHCARLAAHENFGIAGSSIDNLSAEIELPQLRKASLPNPKQFHLDQMLQNS